LFIVNKHLLTVEIFELFRINNSSLTSADHLSKVKKLEFLNISFKIKCFFSL